MHRRVAHAWDRPVDADHRHGESAVNAQAVEDLLERQIDDAYQELIRCKTPEGQRAAFAAMRALCRQRTAETILRMEREKGLAPA